MHVDAALAREGYDQIPHFVFAIGYLKEMGLKKESTEEEVAE